LDTKDESFKLIPQPASMPKFDILIFFSGLTRTLIQTNYNTRMDECKATRRTGLGESTENSIRTE
jgi:galactokinase